MQDVEYTIQTEKILKEVKFLRSGITRFSVMTHEYKSHEYLSYTYPCLYKFQEVASEFELKETHKEI